jgi:hypothetical protein
MDIELPLQALQSRVNTLEKVVQLIAGTLDDPVLRQINSDRGFRYENPDIRHFCVLKAVRVVSALNASIVLAPRTVSRRRTCIRTALLDAQ